MLTNEQYQEARGLKCPNCESRSIEGHDVEIDAGFAYQNCFCTECHSQWTDEYALNGYANLEAEEKAV